MEACLWCAEATLSCHTYSSASFTSQILTAQLHSQHFLLRLHCQQVLEWLFTLPAGSGMTTSGPCGDARDLTVQVLYESGALVRLGLPSHREYLHT